MPYALIIDDDPQNCEILNSMLEEVGFTAIEAYNGPEGLEICKVSTPDVILLDWMMPDMDGIEFLKKLHFLARHSSGKFIVPKVIMCTALRQEEYVRKALMSGVDGYIVKPFSEDILAKQLAKVGVYQLPEGSSGIQIV